MGGLLGKRPTDGRLMGGLLGKRPTDGRLMGGLLGKRPTDGRLMGGLLGKRLTDGRLMGGSCVTEPLGGSFERPDWLPGRVENFVNGGRDPRFDGRLGKGLDEVPFPKGVDGRRLGVPKVLDGSWLEEGFPNVRLGVPIEGRRLGVVGRGVNVFDGVFGWNV